LSSETKRWPWRVRNRLDSDHLVRVGGGMGAPRPSSLALLFDPNLHKCSLLRLMVRFCASVMAKRITRVGLERVWGGFEMVMVYILTRRAVLVC